MLTLVKGCDLERLENYTVSALVKSLKRHGVSMVQAVLQLNDYPVSNLMTAESEMIWLNLDDPTEKNHQKIIESHLSCFLVCRNSLKNMVGIVQVNDLFSASLQGKSFDLTKSLESPVFVSETTKGLEVLEIFKNTHTEMAVVVDDAGTVTGVISLKEILEAIIGHTPTRKPKIDNE